MKEGLHPQHNWEWRNCITDTKNFGNITFSFQLNNYSTNILKNTIKNGTIAKDNITDSKHYGNILFSLPSTLKNSFDSKQME